MSRPSHSDGSVYIKGRSVTSVEPPLSVGAGVVLVEGVSGDAMNPYSMIALDQQTMQKKWEAPLIGSTASGWFEAPSIAHDFAIACIGVIRVWNRRYRRQRLAECRQPDLQVTTHRSGRTLHLHRGSYADAASLGLSNCVRLGRVSITLPVAAARQYRRPPWARLISHAQLFANTHRRNEIVIRSGTEFSYFDDLTFGEAVVAQDIQLKVFAR